MHKSHKLTIQSKDQETRLDVYIASVLQDLSRTYIQKLIKDGNILLNGSPAQVRRLIKTNDQIEITIPELKEPVLAPENISLNTLYEDKHLLVINKQANLKVHPTAGNTSGTLVNALLYHCKDLSGINGIQKPGIVHRLDKNTTGCILVAKSDRAHQGLSDQFKNRSIKKEYHALCWGIPKETTGEINTEIGRDRVNRLKMSTVPVKGRNAITKYSLLEAYEFCSLLVLHLITGRTHQIRVHLTHLGHPVIGDTIYNGGKNFLGQVSSYFQTEAKNCLKLMQRQALHAYSIKFIHPVTEKDLKITAPYPHDFKQTVDYLTEWRDNL